MISSNADRWKSLKFDVKKPNKVKYSAFGLTWPELDITVYGYLFDTSLWDVFMLEVTIFNSGLDYVTTVNLDQYRGKT